MSEQHVVLCYRSRVCRHFHMFGKAVGILKGKMKPVIHVYKISWAMTSRKVSLVGVLLIVMVSTYVYLHVHVISNARRRFEHVTRQGHRNFVLTTHRVETPENISSAVIGSRYFQKRTLRITPLDHEFIVPSSPCSESKLPFLVILCLSKYDHFSTRDNIRQTWGSVSKSQVWPSSNVSVSDVRLLFILGRSNLNATQRKGFTTEDEKHGDIIVADFVDSYNNLTRKVLMGLKWVNQFCSHAKYVLKVDEDTFVHVANLVSYLRSLAPRPEGVVIGHIYPRPPVDRVGKWGLESSIYPYPFYPPYVSGNTYVISANIRERLVSVSEYLPYVFIEDVAITGIMRTAINASLLDNAGFTFFARPPPKLCDFHNTVTISATKTDDKMKVALWNALHMTLSDCKNAANASLHQV